jgi:hypothetical protein
MDILDRCLAMPVDLNLNEAIEFLPDVPKKGGKVMWPNTPWNEILTKLVSYITDLPAPGAETRKCSFAEAETILCAIYGYQKGTYVFGSDLVHRRKELMHLPNLARFLPQPQDWGKHVYSLDTKVVPA